jgi:hypothetical protein
VRTVRRVIVVLLLAAAVTVRAGQWEDLRHRPGNDDVFVMIDSSRSMSAGGSLVTAKVFVQDLLARYPKDGDRVVVMTFDSEAHVRGVIDIAHRPRDVEVLGEMIDAIDVRRVIRYSGSWPDLTESKTGPWKGGSAFSDYCEMWRLAGRVLQTYGDPSHRQMLLLFTNASSVRPDYRACDDPRPPAAIVTALRQNRLRLGLFTPSAAGLPPPLRRLTDRPSVAVDSLKIIELHADRRRVDAVPELLGLLSARVDLIGPEKERFTVSGDGDVRMGLTVVNRSAVPRRIEVRAATLQLDEASSSLPLTVTPSVVTLDPGDSVLLTVARDGVIRKPGTYRGRIVFRFADGDRFHPSILPFEAKKEAWIEHLGMEGTRSVSITVVVGFAICACAVVTSLIVWFVMEKRCTCGRARSWRPLRVRRGRPS